MPTTFPVSTACKCHLSSAVSDGCSGQNCLLSDRGQHIIQSVVILIYPMAMTCQTEVSKRKNKRVYMLQQSARHCKP